MATRAASTTEDGKACSAAALARKRRIELRNLQRSNATAVDDLESDSCAERKRPRDDEPSVDPVTSKPMPSITGIKRQHRYDPGVKMTRDELKAWRKEARRVRNRESAAASRKRNRERITELEGEVDVLKSKYAAALRRIVQLEAASDVHDSFTPTILRQDLMDVSGSDFGSRPSTPEAEHVQTVSPPMSPASGAVPAVIDVEIHAEEVSKKYQHIMDMISRPVVSI